MTNKMISENFSAAEFACKDGSSRAIDGRLLVMLEAVRAHFGRPVRITSGYRSPEYNRRIGGASRSYHCLGQAADIQIDGTPPAEVYAWLDQQYPVSGLGLYPRWVHIDCRGFRARWGTPPRRPAARGLLSFTGAPAAAPAPAAALGGVLITSTGWTLVQGLLEIALRWGLRAWRDRRMSPEGLLDLADELLGLARALQEEARPEGLRR